jgi:hypothetical protein
MNATKRKGASWEYLQESGWTGAERRALAGNADRGDVLGLPGWVIEAKNASRIELAQWVKEAETEAANAGVELAAVWAKREGKASAADGYVVLTGRQFVQLLRHAGY